MTYEFKPTPCPRCAEPMEQVVKVFVTSPAGWRRFDKTGIRSKQVKIGFASEDLIYCPSCGFKVELRK